MKLIPFLLILTFGVVIKSSTPVDDFKKIETNLKTVAIDIEKKKCLSKKEGHTFKLKSKTYFKIVPPEYETIYDTIYTLDPFKYTKEMGALYKLVTEQVLVKKGAFKWVQEENKINFCDTINQFDPLDENHIRLKYQKESDVYEAVDKLVMHSAHFGDISSKERLKLQARATELVNANKINIVRKTVQIKSHGSLEEVGESQKGEKNVFSIEKGNWQITPETKIEQNCESIVRNIQVCLYRLGYDTNVDGEDTLKYKMAKYSFLKDSKLPLKKKEVLIEALGW